jgi:hypothetical protein
MLKKNESAKDRAIRAFIGMALLILSFFVLSGGWQMTAIVVGAILLLTSATGYCLLYKFLGIDSSAREDQ